MRPSFDFFHLLHRILPVLAVCVVLAGATVSAQIEGPFVGEPIAPIVVDVNVADLPVIDPWQPGDPIVIIPEAGISDKSALPVMGGRPGLETRSLPAVPAGVPPRNDIVNVEGIPFQGFLPPDTIGAVGPNHYVQSTNASTVLIFDKSGTVVAGPFPMDSLAPGGDPCTAGSGDPIILYDHLADRWQISEFINPGAGNRLCIYVSQGPDPVTSGWFFYGIPVPAFPDYPKYAVWPDAYYLTTYEGAVLGVFALDRTAMLAGLPTTNVRFTVPSLISAPRDTRLLPAHLMVGPSPPGGTPNFFYRSVEQAQGAATGGERLEIFEFDVDFATPANSTFTLVQSLIPANFDFASCFREGGSVRSCVPQPGTAIHVDALPGRSLMHSHFRYFPGTDTFHMVETQGALDEVPLDNWGHLWFELTRPAGGGPASWSIAQQSVYGPDGESRWMGGIAMNGDGDIALGYSISGTVFPGIRWTGRRAGDPPGTMGPEFSIKEGEGFQPSTSRRWGDYSAMTVDPSDDRTFWYTQQYITPANQWSTRVAAFLLNGIFADGFESGDTSVWDQTVN
jgi:hypothetical protein